MKHTENVKTKYELQDVLLDSHIIKLFEEHNLNLSRIGSQLRNSIIYDLEHYSTKWNKILCSCFFMSFHKLWDKKTKIQQKKEFVIVSPMWM